MVAVVVIHRTFQELVVKWQRGKTYMQQLNDTLQDMDQILERLGITGHVVLPISPIWPNRQSPSPSACSVRRECQCNAGCAMHYSCYDGPGNCPSTCCPTTHTHVQHNVGDNKERLGGCHHHYVTQPRCSGWFSPFNPCMSFPGAFLGWQESRWIVCYVTFPHEIPVTCCCCP